MPKKPIRERPVADMPVAELRRDLEFSAELRGQPLRFATTWGLFSPREIDRGSRLLLEHLHVEAPFDCLDLGCGYGAIGLTLAKLAPQGCTSMVDKDFVAIEYAKRNAKLNRIDNVEIFLSNGLQQVTRADFDLIATNLPAKSGKELYYLFFHEALAKLKPGGVLYVVAITGLREFIAKAFKDIFGNAEKLKQTQEYTVTCARKPSV